MAERICSVEGCGRSYRARGWCMKHYQEFWYAKNGPPVRRTGERVSKRIQEAETGLRFCRACTVAKPLETSFGIERKSLYGRSNTCRECKAAGRQWQKQNGDPERDRRIRQNWALRKRYGISADDYDAMKESQGGLCAACGCEPRRLVVDHCHASGKVRALLCDFCNKALGMARDDAATLAKLITYLERHAS